MKMSSVIRCLVFLSVSVLAAAMAGCVSRGDGGGGCGDGPVVNPGVDGGGGGGGGGYVPWWVRDRFPNGAGVVVGG